MSRTRPNMRVRSHWRHMPFTGPVTETVGPDWLSKGDCPGCVAARAADWADRWPIGFCGLGCLRRLERQTTRTGGTT